MLHTLQTVICFSERLGYEISLIQKREFMWNGTESNVLHAKHLRTS